MTSFTPHTRDLIQVLSGYGKLILMLIALSLGTATNDLNASPEEDVKTVAALDTKYQAAVKSDDAATMDQILADDFVLVTGRGKVSRKADLIGSRVRTSGRGTWNTESQSVGRHCSRDCSPLDQGGAGRQTSRLQTMV